MASETTSTTANDIYFAAFIADLVVEEQRPYSVTKQHFWMQNGQESDAFTWPTQTDPGAAANIAEGTGASNTALSTGAATATATIEGQMATVTDFLAVISRVDALQHFAQVLGRSVAERIEDVCCGLLDDFSNTVGTTTVDLTVAQFLSGVSTLEQNDATGQAVAVLHPVQVGDLRTGVTATANQHFASNPDGDFAIMGGLDNMAGFAQSLFNVPIYQTSAVVTANTGEDRAGAIFIRNHALGYYELWGPRIETERDASLPGTEIVATTSFGVVEVLDREGVSVVSDA